MRKIQKIPGQRGFTLIELMVVVAIVAILAAIAFPSYQGYQKRTRKSEAQQIMMRAADRQMQYMLNARQYASDLATLGVSDDSDVYDISVSSVDNSATPPSFTISAAPVSGTIVDGEPTLTLNHLGNKTPADEWD